MVSRIAMIAAAALLIGFGAPNFLAATWMAIGNPAYQDLRTGELSSGDDIDLVIESREAAVALTGHALAAAQLATAYVQRDTSPESIESAVQSTKRSLAVQPVAPYTWLRLASYLSTQPGKYMEALEAWRTSRTLAPYDTFIEHTRLHVGILLFRYMSEEDRENLMADINRSYEWNRGALRSFARNNNILEWAKFLLRDPEKTAFLSRG